MRTKTIIYMAVIIASNTTSLSALSLFSSNPRPEIERYFKLIEAKKTHTELVEKVNQAAKSSEISAAKNEILQMKKILETERDKLNSLLGKTIIATEQTIRDLKDQIGRRKEDRKVIENGINSLQKTSKTLDSLNKFLGSYLGALLNISQRMTTATKKGAEVNLKEMDKQIESLKASILVEQKNLVAELNKKGILEQASNTISNLKGKFTGLFGYESASPVETKSPKEKLLEISEYISGIEKKLFTTQDKLKDLQKKLIIDAYSDQAEKHMSTIMKIIKDAKCPLIKSIGSMSDDNIKECMRLSLNKVSKITEYKVCADLKKTEGKKITLIPEATYKEIIACAQDYLANSKK